MTEKAALQKKFLENPKSTGREKKNNPRTLPETEVFVMYNYSKY